MEEHKLTQTEIITTMPELSLLVEELGREQVIACDLEADSLHHYQEKVCLIQIATPSRASLVDPLVFTDLSLLGAVLAEPAIRKIFHGADYDIRSLYRDYAFEVNNLFDTMIACQFLGEKEVGLAAVLKKRFGVELDKRYQKADWSKRPLAPEMMAYAIEDTTLLIELFGQLENELRLKGRLSWVEEECVLLTKVRAGSRATEPLYLRFKGAARMEPRALAVLEELLRSRDERAKAADIPPFKILGNDLMRELAEKKPRKPADFSAIDGFPPKLIDRHGRWVLAAVAKGMAVPGENLPRFPRILRQEKDHRREELLKRLKSWREGKAAELGMDAGIVANNNLLEALVEKSPRSEDELDGIEGLKRWQWQAFGAELVEMVN